MQLFLICMTIQAPVTLKAVFPGDALSRAFVAMSCELATSPILSTRPVTAAVRLFAACVKSLNFKEEDPELITRTEPIAAWFNHRSAPPWSGECALANILWQWSVG